MPRPFLFDATRWEEWKDYWYAHDDTIGSGLLAVALVLVILFVVRTLMRRLLGSALRAVVERAESSRRRDPEKVRQRAETLERTLDWTMDAVLMFLATGLVLAELGFNITTLIAGFGIIGIALGLGAQTLVKDVLNGLFILLEDQYGVGDVVSIAGVSGVVEEINPRRTVVRDLDGNVHTVPNSAITVTTNLTQTFSRINLDVEVAYEENVDGVIAVINDVCSGLASDYAGDVITTPEVLRVDALADSGVVIKILGDVRIGTQWMLMGELRRRIKNRFDEEGIEIPYPHRMMVQKVTAPGEAGAEV